LGVAQNFLSCDREQALLLPPSVGEWVPEGHLARFVVEVVERLDLSAFYAAYRADGSGRPAHDPAMMVALVLYNYAVGIRSSRQVERRCVEDVACRFIAANRAPDHVTINRFRARHQDALSALFAAVLALCARAGMVRVGTVAVDSTKMAADASLGANRTYDGLRAEARRIFEQAAEIDAAEDELYGERRGDELPEDLADPKTRAGRIKQLLDELEQERARAQGEHDAKLTARAAKFQRTGTGTRGRPPGPGLPKTTTDALAARKRNITDPDSAIVSHRGMLLQGYNINATVADGQVILAAHASNQATEHGQLDPMVDAARENLAVAGIDGEITQVLADSGYWHAAQVRGLQDHGIDVLVCPRPWKPGSQVKPTNPLALAMADRLASGQGASDYRRRQQIAEPVFAHIKHLRGITRLLRRGKAAVQAEIDLIATTHNLLKLYRSAPSAA
jgi:transposase